MNVVKYISGVKNKVLVNEIAKRLGRHRSTVFREIWRNTYFCEEDKTLNGYFYLNAQEFGHWEVDLMMFERDFGKTNITTLTERKSRYTVLIKNETRQIR